MLQRWGFSIRWIVDFYGDLAINNFRFLANRIKLKILGPYLGWPIRKSIISKPSNFPWPGLLLRLGTTSNLPEIFTFYPNFGLVLATGLPIKALFGTD